jgi:ubiquinone biosynthesis monooxygenase Coq6
VFDSLDGLPTSPEPTGEIPQMARFVENIHLQKALLQNLDKRPLIDLYGSTKVASISSDEANWPLITTEDGQHLKARLLVSEIRFHSL